MKLSEKMSSGIHTEYCDFERYGTACTCGRQVFVDKVAQLEAENEALKSILWACRHGGKGGIPVDYQEETDRLLADYDPLDTLLTGKETP